MEQLKTLWTENVHVWKNRRDYESILSAKDNQKIRLTWPNSLKKLMSDYNACADMLDASISFLEAEKAVDDGNHNEVSIIDLVARVFNEKWPIDASGLTALNVYGDWWDNKEQIKFGV